MPRPRSLVLAGLGLALALPLVLLAPGCGSSHRPPVVVIGLDGADWDLLVPWMEAGHLPHLAAFLEDARVGELETVLPILSPVCWTSATTGVNPGKHGIFNFQKPDPDGGPPIIEQATYRRATPVWMLLSDTGHEVGVLNVPMTFPPDPVRGRMISGFPFPSGEVNLTYPPQYQDEIGEYPIDYLSMTMHGRTAEELLADFYAGLEARGKLAREWAASGDYDFLWMVFTAPDKVQHFFWAGYDPLHPWYSEETAARFGTTMLDLWKRQDEILGEILAELPADATVMLVSDHGFESIRRQVNMANWFEQEGINAWLDSHAIPDITVTNGILAFTVEGKIAGSSDREEFLDLLVQAAGDLRDPASGNPPIEGFFRREEIYHGPSLEKAPDIIFYENPFFFTTEGYPDSSDAPVVENLTSTSFSGYHRPHGILALAGPDVLPPEPGTVGERIARGGDFRDANLMDVTPTLLALFGETIPERMDGRVLLEGLRPEFLQAHPPRLARVEGFLLDREPPRLSETEKEALKALPYLQ